jgi:type II secretory pathway predicted ATPase ExeA
MTDRSRWRRRTSHTRPTGRPSTGSWSTSLLAIVLLGQPTLRRVLRRGSYAALDQRIAVRYKLNPLDTTATADYLRHHLAVAGRSDPLFADGATTAMAHAARGLPRQIGNLAVAALIAGYARRNTIIDHDCAVAAIADAAAE